MRNLFILPFAELQHIAVCALRYTPLIYACSMASLCVDSLTLLSSDEIFSEAPTTNACHLYKVITNDNPF